MFSTIQQSWFFAVMNATDDQGDFRRRDQRSRRARRPPPNMRRTIRLVAIFSVAFVPALAVTAGAAESLPNIIIVMPDDVGYGDFSCLGSPIVKTPSIDAFSRDCVRFTDFHVSPTCALPRGADDRSA